jgi:hypothetical protein
MKTTFAVKLLAATSACLLIALPVRAGNLLLNPGFEDSRLGRLQNPPNPSDPWTGLNVVNVVGSNVYSGTKAAQLQATPGSAAAALIQEVPGATMGQEYIIEFWAKSAGPGLVGAAFSMGAPLSELRELSGATEYTDYFFTFTATPLNASPKVYIFWSIPLGATLSDRLYVDNVSLTEVPEPSAVALLLLGFGAGAVRLLRRPRPA